MRLRDGRSVSGAAYRRQHVHDRRRVRTHLELKSAPLTTVILISWGIRFFEYRLHRYRQPAGRRGVLDIAAQGHAGGGHAAGARGDSGHPLKWKHGAFARIVGAALPLFKK